MRCDSGRAFGPSEALGGIVVCFQKKIPSTPSASRRAGSVLNELRLAAVAWPCRREAVRNASRQKIRVARPMQAGHERISPTKFLVAELGSPRSVE